ncbi:hypothetical protein BSY240_4626 (plasmid) [Agrobacterium sp. RAC06]|nr:hypothetical protein BSY240_4626 [Agrobacterium sp. RAC06]
MALRISAQPPVWRPERLAPAEKVSFADPDERQAFTFRLSALRPFDTFNLFAENDPYCNRQDLTHMAEMKARSRT